MTDRILNMLDDYIRDIQGLSIHVKDTVSRDDGSVRHGQTSPDEFGPEAGLVKAISDDGSIPTPVRQEDCIFTGFPDMPMPTTDNHGRRFGISDAGLDLADFGAEPFVINERDPPATRENVSRWLDRLPEADSAAEGSTVDSTVSFDSSSDASAGRLLSCNEVNVALAKRGVSAFRELSGEPWELRRPSEV
ncbi:MAG: hypothetical protein LQ338_006188 [Usnochroma carphineum]|nr:MAG: hypothetical protein LQ338_006188 [Usnochroma carphineum]